MGKFQKRHYEVVAHLMKMLMSGSNGHSRSVRYYAVLETIVEEFKKDNPRFDERKFKERIWSSKKGT